MLKLYGFDVDSGDPREIEALNAAIAHAYSNMFAWYRAAMDKAHFSEVIRPVHPEYFTAQQSPETAARESAFVNTIMRIDSLLALWPRKCPRRDALANILGVEPVDAKSWREFIHAILDLAAENGTTGIKQAQAYDRRLTFVAREDSEVAFSADMTPEQVRVWQDWAAHVCFEYADDRGWPHQVHVGTHNLPHSSPLPLGDVAARYGRMKLVQIHCWPFLKEAGWLAKHYPNVYIDSCWLPILSPGFYREALMTWLNYVPIHKLMCSHDATCVEMAVGSSLFTREILAEALVEQTHSFGLSTSDLEQTAADLLHNNAATVYGIGVQKTTTPAHSLA